MHSENLKLKLLAVSVGLASLLLNVACTEHGKPIVEHQPDRRTATQPVILDIPEGTKPSTDAQIMQKHFLSAKDSLSEVLLPMAKRVLDLKRVGDPASLNSRAVLDDLIMFNHLILQTSSEDRTRPEFKQLLAQYETALNIDCGVIAESCSGLRYFKMSANSAQVVKLIAQNDSDHYFRMLLIAVSMKNHTWDDDLVLMLYAKPIENLDQTELKFRGAVKSLLEMALQQLRDKTADAGKTRKFLDDIHAWNLVEGGIEKFDGSTQESLYAMMAKAHMLYSDGTGLHPELKRLLADLEKQRGGFFDGQNQLREQKQFSAGAVGAKFIDHFDELYFIVDAVFNAKISAQSGALLFASTNKSADDLRVAVENYLRIEFLVTLKQSTELAKKLFQAQVKTEDLPFYFIRESASIKGVWATLDGHALPLQNFSTLASQQRPGSQGVARELKSVFDSIQKSISVSAVYPYELVLFHLLSQKHFAWYSPFTGKKYDSGDFMRLLWSGTMEPLLTISENKETPNQFQLVYAFDFALRTNLFSALGINPDLFIANTLRMLNGSNEDFINSSLNLIQTRFKQAPTYLSFKGACREFSGEPSRRRFYFTEVNDSPIYGTLLNDAFAGVADQSFQGPRDTGGLAKSSMGLFYLDPSYAEVIEQARLGVGTNSRLGHAMLYAYQAQLSRDGITGAAADEKTILTRTSLDKMDQLRAKVLTTAKTWFDDIGQCYWKADARDHRVQLQVIDMERAYLRQVYRDILKLRKGADANETAKIQSSLQFTGLPSGFKGLDRISADGYVYNQIDLQIRVARYVTSGLQTEQGTLPAIAPDVQIEFGDRLDMEMDSLKDSRQHVLAFTASEDDFVESGIKTAFNSRGGNAYLSWTTLSGGRIISWQSYLMGIVSLYRLEHELKGANTDFTAQRILSSQEEILGLLKLSPEERAFYASLHLNFKFDPVFLSGRILEWNIYTERIQDTWGLFDLPVRLMNEEQLGAVFDSRQGGGEGGKALPERLSLTLAGQLYYKSRSKENRGTAVIPYNHELDLQLDKSLIDFVKGDAQAVYSFQNLTESYLAQVEQRPVSERPRADINVFISVQEPMVTETFIPGFRAKMQSFDRTTGFCFSSDKPCAGFAQ